MNVLGRAVKALDGQAGRIGGYCIVWGSPQQRDLHGEYFTKQTDLKLDHYDRRPTYYHHGVEKKTKSLKIGEFTVVKTDDVGVWAEAQLDLSNRYIRAVYELVKQGKLHWSTGANPNLVELEQDGHIKQWPLIEGSLTPTPAEPRYTNIQQIKTAIKSVEFAELEALINDAEIDWAAMGEELPDAPLGTKAAAEDSSDTPEDGDPDAAKTPEEEPPVDAEPDPPTEDEEPVAKTEGGASPDASLGTEAVTKDESDTPEDGDPDAAKTPEEEPPVDADTPPPENDDKTDAAGEGDDPKASTDEPPEEAEPEKDAPPPSETDDAPPADPPAAENPPAAEHSPAAEDPPPPSEEPEGAKSGQSPDPSTTEDDKGDFAMDDHALTIVSTLANGLSAALTDEATKGVADWLLDELAKPIGGREKLTVDHLKLGLSQDSFKTALVGKIQEAAKSTDDPKDDEALQSLTDDLINSVKGGGGTPQTPPATTPEGGAPAFVKDYGAKLLWDTLSAADMSYLHEMRVMACQAAQKQFKVPDFFVETYFNKLKEDLDEFLPFMEFGQDALGNEMVPQSIKAYEGVGQLIHQGVKADELNHRSNMGFGREWINEAWQMDLWRQERSETRIAQLIRSMTMPTDPYRIPLQGDTPEAYTAPETTDDANLTVTGPLSASRIPTSNLTMTSKKLGIRSTMSKEVTEDSIISLLPYTRAEQMRTLTEAIDNVILNADPTNDNSNINSDGSTPTKNSKFLLGINGMVKFAMDDGKLIDAGNALGSLGLFRRMHDGLDDYFLNRGANLAIACTPKVFTRLKSMDKFLEAEVQTGRITGQIGNIDGVPVVMTHEFGDGKESGKRSATASENDRGRALIFYRPHMLIGYRRRIESWMEYRGAYDAYQMGVWVRFDFIRRDSIRPSVVMLRNLKVS